MRFDFWRRKTTRSKVRHLGRAVVASSALMLVSLSAAGGVAATAPDAGATEIVIYEADPVSDGVGGPAASPAATTNSQQSIDGFLLGR